MNFKKILIVNNEKINENPIDNTFNKEKLRFPDDIKSLIPNKVTAAKVGIDNKKEILAASTLSNSKSLPAVIVIPDLLTPGINESTWNKPIKIADL